jgi:hypothetical protein
MIHNATSMMRLVNQGMREYGIALSGEGKTLEDARRDIVRGYKFPQILYMSCGHKQKVDSIEDVPSVDTPCPCGNPKHWIVKYELEGGGQDDPFLYQI